MTTPEQPLTVPPGTADTPLSTPPGTAVPSPEMPSAKIDYSLPPKIEIVPSGHNMKTVYKFFQLAILNAKEELNFNKEFADQGWVVAGLSQHGARIIVLGVRLEPIVEEVEDTPEEEEEAVPGVLDGEIDVKETVETSSKTLDPFAKVR